MHKKTNFSLVLPPLTYICIKRINIITEIFCSSVLDLEINQGQTCRAVYCDLVLKNNIYIKSVNCDGVDMRRVDSRMQEKA